MKQREYIGEVAAWTLQTREAYAYGASERSYLPAGGTAALYAYNISIPGVAGIVYAAPCKVGRLNFGAGEAVRVTVQRRGRLWEIIGN